MDVEHLAVADTLVVTPNQIADQRGTFLEWFRADALEAAIGHRLTLAQCNSSISKRGVLRGVHFSEVPPGMAKYVSCTRGAIFDVVVDVRPGSPTYGAWDGVRLDDVDRRSVYVPEGVGHAFLALADDSVVSYLCSTAYTPSRDHEVNAFDPALGIEWPADVEAVLSDKDRAAPTLAEAAASGVLPTYDECQAFYDRLRKVGTYT
ncbi:MAG: dTDP-4-dehydrorhamnose 3,5-epimerase [Actinomycetota bacterium]|nr:dTDP-4-dehydrorhamnose 3,5-epimerase [Actinomycetota bacterium]